jgi:hypothetical protein
MLIAGIPNASYSMSGLSRGTYVYTKNWLSRLLNTYRPQNRLTTWYDYFRPSTRLEVKQFSPEKLEAATLKADMQYRQAIEANKRIRSEIAHAQKDIQKLEKSIADDQSLIKTTQKSIQNVPYINARGTLRQIGAVQDRLQSNIMKKKQLEYLLDARKKYIYVP